MRNLLLTIPIGGLIGLSTALILTACGGSGPTSDEEFKDDCLSNGGTYVQSQYSSDSDQCIYEGDQ